MELIIMILAPFPIGFLVRQRVPAYIAYVALHSFVFTFQSLALVREWVGGDPSAFAKSPDAVPWSYAVVNLVIFGVGLGLVELGHRLAARHRARSEVAVDLAA